MWLKPLIEENQKIALWFKHWMKSKKQKRTEGRGKISSAFSKWLDIITEFQAQHGGYFCAECCTEASFSLFNLCITIGKCQQCKKNTHIFFFSLTFQHTFWLLAASVCLLIRFLCVFPSFFSRVDLSCAHLKNLTAHRSICKMRLAETEGFMPKGSFRHISWTYAVKNAKSKVSNLNDG